MANLVTGLRALLVLPFVGCVVAAESQRAWGWLAGVLFGIAAASDVIDGPMARRAGTASNSGRFYDHFADIIFVMVALSSYTLLGIVPWWVPSSIAASFGYYVIDSLRRTVRQPSLIGSQLGHWGGVANYVLIGVLVFNHSAGIDVLPEWLMMAMFGLVPLYSLGAVAARSRSG